MNIKYYHKNNGIDLCKNMNTKESFNYVSNFFSKWVNVENFNVLIGSGCSRNAIPLMNETFLELIQNNKSIYNNDTYKPFSEYKKKQLREKGFSAEIVSQELNKTINIEEYLNWLNQAIQFYEFVDQEKLNKFKQAFECTINGLVNSMESDIEKYFTNGEYRRTLENYINYYNLIFRHRNKNQKIGSMNIFTSNYDLFNEVALEQINVHYTTGFKGGVNRTFTPSMFRLRLVDDENRYKEKWDPVRRFVKLYKLHGSLNWIEKNGEIIQIERIDDDDERRMIYPYVSKHNLTRQTPYSELFREFSISMQKSNSVLFVMGYGFPDEHINQIIKQGLDNPDLTIIIFGNDDEGVLKHFLEDKETVPNLHIIGGKDVDDKLKTVGHHFHNIVNLLGGGNNELKL